MTNNDMNIELLKAMRGAWIIELETLEKKIKHGNEYREDRLILVGKHEAITKCLDDLIAIIGE